ncbi:uncharacterized protein LOC141596686 isoform X2 [Silene latifolia]|uniref:uncharacterized protein LOC141596686 isoform X2 n=1 Tax=Silene latifolia TaxID=37657 RepID=UPI003D778140
MIYMMRVKLKSSYLKDLDNMPLYYVLLPCAFAAALAHPRGGYSIFIRFLWLFSMSVEAISVLPQLRLIQNAKVFHCFGQYFCLHFEAFQLGMAPVYMAFLRFMGDESEARKYNHSLEVGGYGSKLTCDGPPRSIRDSYRKVRQPRWSYYPTQVGAFLLRRRHEGA